jgi:protein-tyrosine phosphatase
VSDWFERFGWGEVGEGLVTGAYPLDAGDVAELAGLGVTAIFNLCEDREYEPGERDGVGPALEAAGIAEVRLPCEDYGHLLPGALEESTRTVLEWLDAGERVYLHCRAGWQRSATVAAAVVALREEVSLEEALSRVRARKPTAEPLPHQIEDLQRWWRARSVRKEA